MRSFGLSPQSSTETRLSLAREKFFGDGQPPIGLVSNEIIRSWTRCKCAGLVADTTASIAPVARNLLQNALRRARRLREAAAPDIDRLGEVLERFRCAILLVDRDGIVVTAVRNSHANECPVITQVARLGVDMSEPSLGTTAPGVVLNSGRPCTILGSEHYFAQSAQMYCAAAPVRDSSGRLAGILNLATEAVPFSFDPGELVGLFAASIENRLLQMVPLEHLIVRIQFQRELLGTPYAGLIGIDPAGQVLWMNHVARHICGAGEGSSDEAMGASMNDLSGASDTGQPRQHRLPNGLTTWIQVQRHARCPSSTFMGTATQRDDARAVEAAAEPFPTLGRARRDLIEEALRMAGGNVTRAAKSLGVSRGSIYRQFARQRQS